MVIRYGDGLLFMVMDGIGIRCTSEHSPSITWASDLLRGEDVAAIYDKVPENKVHRQITSDSPITKCLWGLDDYVKRQDAAGFKVGDLVEVWRKSIPDDWCNVWFDDRMKVGTIGKVERIAKSGITVKGWTYPYNCLHKLDTAVEMTVSELEEKLGYPVKIVKEKNNE